MDEDFLEPIYDEIAPVSASASNVLKSSDLKIIGNSKISIDEDSHDGVTIFLKKDANDNIHEIKFICSCGKTKSIILDYSDQ
ncbi:hypothetical protein BMS3Abin03_02002 [bacterium BMS3Abin03]|nr:hypothetical protein BMS3Abin03_02002 [bacterium BMS3Abin03]